MVTLRTPLGNEAARAAVRAFFHAVAQEDLNALGAVVAPGAVIQELPQGASAGSSRTREALNFWGQRFRQKDYGALGSQLVYRETDIETIRAADVDALPAVVRRGPGPGAGRMAESDLVLRVPVLTPSVRSERLLGSEVYFWLRRTGDRYVISYIAEPYPF